MTSAHPTASTANPSTPHAAATQSPLRTLRDHLATLRHAGQLMTMAQAVEVVVPLCAQADDLHRQGQRLLVHPSNIIIGENGRFQLAGNSASRPPTTNEDAACLPPESQATIPGDARASVYSLGAVIYELVTGLSVGVGMRRPAEVNSALPAALEGVLARALVADPRFRPADLGALANALFDLAPVQTISQPRHSDVSLLNQAGDFEVDVSLSMLPPAPAVAPPNPLAPPTSGLNLAVSDQRGQNVVTDAATQALSTLKAKLESDPRPRYVVIKQGMDHGPFNAVELLRQIANHTFEADDLLQDQATNDQRRIADWSDFAPFAEHAKRHRDHAQEKAAIDQSVEQESKRTKGKAALGFAVLGLALVGAGVWFLTKEGTRSDTVEVQTDTVANIEAEGDLKGVPGKAKAKRRVVGKAGGVPILSGGMSCGAAQAAYVEELKMTGGGPADITRGQYAAIMNNGSYFSHCGVPSNVGVSICAAVQNGRAVGVTVTTKPKHPSRSCVASAVRRKKFPSHPKLDVVRVSFAAQ